MSGPQPSQSSSGSSADKRRRFRDLHQAGCFVMPNPWSIGSARYLEGLGFRALATTSAGFAHAEGRADGDVPLARMLAHFRDIVGATDLPVNADFQGGFARDPGKVAENVRLCIDTGVAGLSIEDSSGDAAEPLYAFDVARSRVEAARAAIDETRAGVVLTARTEGFVIGRPDLDETLRRIEAFAHAGADCLYAPGIRTRAEIAAIVQAAAPKPVNFLNAGAFGYTVGDLATMGVRRISVGASLARAAMTAFMRAAREIAENGTFEGFADLVSNAELNAFFRDGGSQRP